MPVKARSTGSEHANIFARVRQNRNLPLSDTRLAKSVGVRLRGPGGLLHGALPHTPVTNQTTTLVVLYAADSDGDISICRNWVTFLFDADSEPQLEVKVLKVAAPIGA